MRGSSRDIRRDAREEFKSVDWLLEWTESEADVVLSYGLILMLGSMPQSAESWCRPKCLAQTIEKRKASSKSQISEGHRMQSTLRLFLAQVRDQESKSAVGVDGIGLQKVDIQTLSHEAWPS